MKIVLSRKGFDSAAGGAPSPIIDGRPITMPIPATKSSATTYNDLGLGKTVENITAGKIGAAHLCHHDPMFVGSECWFGQCGIAQSHLTKQGVGPGDIFLFFGLFADETTSERHHRFFGYLKVSAVHRVSEASPEVVERLHTLKHPHVLGIGNPNNTVYRGEGVTAARAPDSLRLTRPGGPVSRWLVPLWLRDCGLTYHAKPARWTRPDELECVARGQEFVYDISDCQDAQGWTERIVAEIRS